MRSRVIVDLKCHWLKSIGDLLSCEQGLLQTLKTHLGAYNILQRCVRHVCHASKAAPMQRDVPDVKH
jgi:hypothetical protein